MRSIDKSSLTASVWLILGVACGTSSWAVGSRTLAEEAATPTAQLSRSFRDSLEPTSRAQIYRRLGTPVRVDFDDIPYREAFRRLSAASGVDIQFVEPNEEIVSKGAFGKTRATHAARMSLQKAIQLVMDDMDGLFELVLDEDAVRVVYWRDVGDAPVLRSYDLSYRTDYSTAFRSHYLDQICREFARDDPDRADGPWAVPGRSIFTVDVYQTLKKQGKIRLPPAASHGTREFPLLAHGNSFAEYFTDPPDDISREEWVDELRQKFAFQSLEHRLNYRRRPPAEKAPTTSAAVGQRLAGREAENESLDWKSDWTPTRIPWQAPPGLNLRAFSLRLLHSEQVQEFIESPGFGVYRGAGVWPHPYAIPMYTLVSNELPTAEIDPPSSELFRDLQSNARAGQPYPVTFPAVDRLVDLHESGVNAFLSPYRFGYFQDRRHVAGFEPHGFEYLPRLEKLPPTKSTKSIYANPRRGYSVPGPSWRFAPTMEPKEQWVIQRLELVSLLMHDQTCVYVSNELPRMEDLIEYPTRAPTDFEAAAIPQLVGDQDIVTRATTNRIDMVGAICAAQHCTACHEVKRGSLLGAFSYTLVRDPLLPPATDETTQLRSAAR